MRLMFHENSLKLQWYPRARCLLNCASARILMINTTFFVYNYGMSDPQNIVLELLRAIRGDLSEVKTAIAALRERQISIREEIQSLRRDALR